MLNPKKLPNPNESFYFRNSYGVEALHNARKEVEKLYPGGPIETVVHGDYRAKDTFSLRCVDIEAELEKGTPAQNVLSIVKKWAPVKRTDLHPDDIASGTIEYNEGDPKCLDILRGKGLPQSLTLKAAERARHQLTKNGPPQAGRVPLSEKMKAALGPLEQVDVFERLPENKKQKAPRVVCASNILQYGDLKEQIQFARNLQETCDEGSRLVVGPAESILENNIEELSPSTPLSLADYLPLVLQRHGFSPDEEANLKIKEQRKSHEGLCAALNYKATPLEKNVYIKTER